MKKEQGKEQVHQSIQRNRKYLKDKLGIGVTFDVDFRTLHVLGRDIDFYFVNGLVDTDYVIEILKKIIDINDDETNKRKIDEIVENRLTNHQIEKVEEMDKAIQQLLSGLLIVVIDGVSHAYIVDTRNYPGRGPSEPDTEKVVRGARDGYTENIIENTGLTRRRVRDEGLRFEIMQVGERSKMDVCVVYIEDIADPGLVDEIKNQINSIKVDGLAMADKSLEEFIVSQGINPFPKVRYTERPDVASAHLFEGHVLIMVDTSPSVMITPTTYFHHVQHAEEYRQVPTVGTFVRWVRFFGIFASLLLLPLWLLFVLHPELLPPELSYIGPNEEGNIPIIIQVLLADLGIEFLRIAAIHTPTALSTAMGLIAAVLIGEIAIEVGLFGPEVILYVALSAIGSYSTPSYELAIANKLTRLVLILFIALLGVKGFVIGVTLYILFMARSVSLNTPYFWPLIPFNARAMMHILFRVSVPLNRQRPSIVHPQNNDRLRNNGHN
ncbi:spore germination protein [Halalkalibacillus sediminis]|nr:spore germination protein [Halalkalibacillus sediminis]